ncbi:hypothetical protein [Nonomuraea dietziae]|uniref:hypothetical protein n=1 Tax=Nonomuraea dietziae TaxID=65515 RepID=UPI0031DF4B74
MADPVLRTAGALFEAAHTLPPQVEMVGVDLWSTLRGPQGPAHVAPRITALVAA